jgi:hypothetical protein
LVVSLEELVELDSVDALDFVSLSPVFSLPEERPAPEGER